MPAPKMPWPKKSPNGPGWWRAQCPTYYTRKPGWAVEERSTLFKPLTDWEFIDKHGGKIPVWARPGYKQPACLRTLSTSTAKDA
jgi:hypothetical protein